MKYPRPLAAAVDTPAGNYYNSPLRADGSDFPCKGLHKKSGVDMKATETWQAGQQTRFELLWHGTSSGEGSMAAHSGGSCQASLSFDNGETWKVLHTYTGGCPRGVRLGSNMADKNQTFTFKVPANTKAGKALFSWSWIAVTGNRNEYYQNCASVSITGSGTSTLNDLPDMFVGDMTLAGHIGAGQCRSTAGYALEYPNPGAANTIVAVQSIGFKKPTVGKCFTKASSNTATTSTSSIRTSSTKSSSPATTTKSRTIGTPSTTLKASSTTLKASSTTLKASLTTLKVSSTSKTPTRPMTMTMSTMLTVPGSLPSQCFKYTLITDKTRHSTQPGYIGCDKGIFKNSTTWVRFSGDAGSRLITGPIQPFRCGTQGAGWYTGYYPSASGATIEGTVCYSWPGKSCQWSNPISVTNCKTYYVFALRAPPACYLRYCTI